MSWASPLFMSVYSSLLLVLGLYGLHRYWILYLYYRHFKWVAPRGVPSMPDPFPVVTIQLPLFNERYVAERLIESVTQLDYPKDRLEVQVLDDSTDDTTAIVAAKVAELRQQGFLWAADLSTYDSILNLPFTIPFYGAHVSLWCLLMTITTIISTHLNSQATAGNTMPGMKTMMYMMPVMFLFILNSYSSGLSYYYFLANVITIGQTYLVRGMVDEEKIRAQMLLNKKKTVTKSKFQQRLEQMAKERGVPMNTPRKK